MHLESPRLIYHATEITDIDNVIDLEGQEENSEYICSSTLEQHLVYLKNPEFLHVLISTKSNSPIGFLLISGLNSSNKSIELRRVIISKKRKGYGREVLKAVKELCFKQLKYNRLWLDVFDFNQRAISLYKSEGFREEGLLRESVYKNGQFRDLIVMSLLAKEFIIQ